MKERRYFLSAGFTLIELMLAVSIFATIATVLYASLRGGIMSWRRIESEIAAANRLRYAFNRINGDFRNMVFLSNLPFEGTADSVKFVSFIKSGEPGDTGLGFITYAFSAGDESDSAEAITRTEEPLRYALSVKSFGGKDKGQKQAGQDRLLGGISGLKFSYLSVSEEGKEGEETRYEWIDEWKEQGAIPLGVRIEFMMASADGTKDVKISKRILIPTVKLPEKGKGAIGE